MRVTQMPEKELVLLDTDPGLLSLFHFCKSERTWFRTKHGPKLPVDMFPVKNKTTALISDLFGIICSICLTGLPLFFQSKTYLYLK